MLIPALDEEEALPAVLRALPKDQLQAVVVADNGSRDGTVAVARAAGAAVAREAQRGYGAACLAGIAWLETLQPPPETVVFLDADHPEDAESIPRLLTPMEPTTESATGSAPWPTPSNAALAPAAPPRVDLVLGVRTGPGGETGNLRSHANAGNRLVLALAWMLFGRRFRDLPPFRAVRFAALRELAMDDRNWGWTLQMQLRALRLGLTVAEVDVPHLPRSQGRSKISGRLGLSLKVGIKMFYTLVRERLRPARRPGPTRTPATTPGRGRPAAESAWAGRQEERVRAGCAHRRRRGPDRPGSDTRRQR